MYVSDLALTDFRSYHHVVLSLEPGITALVGANGQGKTNLVEAIAYLSTFSSHRVAGDQALVRHGAQRAVVAAKVMRAVARSEEHTSELQSRGHLVCRLLLEKKKNKETVHQYGRQRDT